MGTKIWQNSIFNLDIQIYICYHTQCISQNVLFKVHNGVYCCFSFGNKKDTRCWMDRFVLWTMFWTSVFLPRSVALSKNSSDWHYVFNCPLTMDIKFNFRGQILMCHLLWKQKFDALLLWKKLHQIQWCC